MSTCLLILLQQNTNYLQILLKIWFQNTQIINLLSVGDFNLPGISWSNDDEGLIYSTMSGSRSHCVPESLAANNFYQVNNVVNSFDSILDLVFVTHSILSVYKAPIPVVPEDHFHPALSIDLIPEANLPMIFSSHSFFDFRRADYASINEFFLYQNWVETIS